MTHYAGSREARAKEDSSPVTDADIEAHHLILAALQRLNPAVPVISEEDEALATLRPSPCFWLVDPLDGTRGFVSGKGDFTVNIGLIEADYPTLGAIYIPRQDTLYLGGVGSGAMRQRGSDSFEPVYARTPPAGGMRVIQSSHHPSVRMQEFLKRYPVQHSTSASSSVKFCVLAEGGADLYPRLGRTMEWDTAAGQAILEAAGGRMETLEGKRFHYGKPHFENPGFMAFGK